MRRRHLLLGGLLAVPAAVGLYAWPTASDAAGPKFSDAEFTAVRAAVKPAPGEDQFAGIPWVTSLWEARTQAAKEGKPILLWEMDGHPLGCG